MHANKIILLARKHIMGRNTVSVTRTVYIFNWTGNGMTEHAIMMFVEWPSLFIYRMNETNKNVAKASLF
jgi:hypothetical protein